MSAIGIALLVVGQGAWLIGLAIACGGLGAAAWRCCFRQRPLDAALAIALGLAVLAQAALLCALPGALFASVPLAMLVSSVGVWLVGTRRVLVRWPERASLPWVAAVVVPAFALALYPPTGFDQTLYHLPFAERFAATGGVGPAPDLRFPVFPPLMELLQALVLRWGGATATQQVGVLTHGCAAALTWTLTRRIAQAPLAAAAAVTVLGAPLLLHAASAGYVEPLLACWAIASTLLAMDAAGDEEIRAAGLAGALGGSLVAAKYTGLVLLATLWLPLLTAPSPAGWPRRRRWLVAWTIGAALLCAPSTMRLVWYTGNPVFPYAPSIFGLTAWHTPDVVQPQVATVGAVTFLADTVVRRGTVGSMPHGPPLLVLAVPLALVAAWRRPRVAGPLLATLVVWILVVPPWAHYAVAVLPYAAALTGAGLGWVALPRRWGAALVAMAAAAGALTGPAYVVYRWRLVGAPPSTAQARDDWTLERLPVLAAVRMLDARDPEAVIYGVSAERYVWFSRGRLLGDYNGPWRHAEQLPLARARGVSAVLDRMGARYLLLRRGVEDWPALAARDAGLRLIFADASAVVYERIAPPAPPPVTRGPA